MKKYISVGIITILIIAIFFALKSGSNNESADNTNSSLQSKALSQNVTIKDGVQYINIIAKWWYFPQLTNAKAGMTTKLVIKTQDTYDCSSSLRVESAHFQKSLQPTGEEVIELWAKNSWESVKGLCSMGMYNFNVNFH